MIYSIHDAVIVTDSSERLVLANDAAGDLFGFDARKSSCVQISEIIKITELVDIIKKSRQSKTRHSRHELTLDRSNNRRIFGCVVSCIYDEAGQPCGTIAVLHDITKEKEISQMKNEFVCHVSHELKTPLASITAYAEMLVDGEAADDETRAEFYSIIQTQAQRLNRLIEDILNISRIESGLVKVNKDVASMTILIRDAVQMIKSYAAEKKIEIFEQEPIVFDQVYVDKDMISQVIINLLSNAVKYTPSGGQVHVGSEVNEADGLVRVSVRDTGVGIPVTEVDRVFDKFYRGPAARAGGTGLGLSIVKGFVEAQGGQIKAENRSGGGALFTIRLPLSDVPPVSAETIA
jgi:two-component system phosphate regulon sensor histidine kinase PhoR